MSKISRLPIFPLLWAWLLGMAALAGPLRCSAQSMPSPLPSMPVLPATAAQTLAGRSIILPAPRRLTLVVGAAWWQEANSLCARHAVLECYQAVVPSEFGFSFTSLALKGLKRATPASNWDRFAVLSGPIPAWKRALGSSRAAKAYAVLLAPDGGILWSAHSTKPSPFPDSLEAILLANAF